MNDSTEPLMQGMGKETFALALFFWFGKAHGQ
jgi:hypothetical protein